MSARHELTAADGTPEEPLPDFPPLTAHDGVQIWMNRARPLASPLAESRLATLRSAYEPTTKPEQEAK
jgi:hypothetical protein